MPNQFLTGNAKIVVPHSWTIDSVASVINLSKMLDDKFSYIAAKTSSIVEKEELRFNLGNRRAKLQYESDERWDRCILYYNGLPVISTYIGEEAVPAPTSTEISPGVWTQTLSSRFRIGVPYKKLWWFNDSQEIEVHPNIFQSGTWELSYNKLTKYTSLPIVLGLGESWYIDWQLYNRRSITTNPRERLEEVEFLNLVAELIKTPIENKAITTLWRHQDITTYAVPSSNWEFTDEGDIRFIARNYYDDLSRYSVSYEYYQTIEEEAVAYTVEITQSIDGGETWGDWELINRNHLIDKNKGLWLKFKVTIDMIADVRAWRMKAFCCRRVREVI
jgi:hypothetical protein